VTRTRLKINIFLVGLSVSYLTLGAANEPIAARLWWIYAIVSGALAATNLLLAGRN
jgi:hypothetical protein